MSLPTSQVELIEFFDRHLTRADKSRMGWYNSLRLISFNPSMIEWAITNANRLARKGFVVFNRKFLAGCPSELAFGHIANYGPNNPAWAKSPRRESEIHYFWLSANYSDSAVDAVINRANNPVPEQGDFGHNVWWNMLCQNPNPRVLQIIYDNYDTFREDQKQFDPCTKAESNDILNIAGLASNSSATEWVLANLEDYFHSNDSRHAPLWKALSKNPHPNAIAYLRTYPLRADHDYLARNTNPEAIALLQELVPNNKSLSRYSKQLSSNPAAIRLLKSNQFLINYVGLATNPHPWAIGKFAKWAMEKQRKCPEPAQNEELESYNKDTNELQEAFRGLLKYNYWNAYVHAWSS